MKEEKKLRMLDHAVDNDTEPFDIYLPESDDSCDNLDDL